MAGANEVILTTKEARDIASMLRYPSHWEASVLRRMGLRLDARAQHAEEQDASRQRLVDMYPARDGVTALGEAIAAVELRKERERD